MSSEEDSTESDMTDIREPEVVAREKTLKETWSLLTKVLTEVCL